MEVDSDMQDKGKCVENLRDSLVELDHDRAIKAAMDAINEGHGMEKIVTEGIGKGLQIMGKKYENSEIFLPELTIAGDIGNEVMELLKKHIKVKEATSQSKKIVFATTKGDIHDLGKRIVGAMLTAAGYEVVDLGVDISESKAIDEAERIGAKFICLSSSMTTTMTTQKDLIRLLEEIGLRDKYKVVVGGGPVSQEWAYQIGADGYAENAFGVVHMLEELGG